MIRFGFQLRPVGQVHRWGADGRSLHWFGLTDGWYWIEVGGHELLRYSDDTLRRWRADGWRGLPYAEYPVVRLWEDLLTLLPAAVEPVPADLVPFVASDPADWIPWDERSEQEDQAVSWYGDHDLDCGHLTNAPHLRCWRTVAQDADAVTVDWRITRSGEIAFAGPQRARYTVSTADFVAAVEDLDRRLMGEMDTRVGALERHGVPPDVDLDLAGLRAEHDDRRTWWRHATGRRRSTDWAAVRAGAAALYRSTP